MIYLYSGTPGSGKSLHQAKEMITFLQRKRPIIANYQISPEYVKRYRGLFYYLPFDKLEPDILTSFARCYWKGKKFHEGHIKLFLDESQLMFNARSWSQQGRSEWLQFFTQHRKYGYDIYLIAQFDRMIDRQIRSLIEYEVIHRKVSNYGFFGWILSLIFGGKLFVAVESWYPLSQKIGSSFYIGTPKLWNMYDSYLDFSAK